MIAFLIGFAIGALGSALVIRNNAAKAAKMADKGKSLIAALKGK